MLILACALIFGLYPAAPVWGQAPAAEESAFAGSWKGTGHTGEFQYRVFFHIESGDDGELTARLEVPARKLANVPMSVSVKGDSIVLEGKELPFLYRGALSDEGRSNRPPRIEGEFNGEPLPLTPLSDPVRAARLDDPFSEPFRGIVFGDDITRGLFPVRSTGVSTEPVVNAADTLLASFTPEQRERATFPVESDEWRHWTPSPFLDRRGVSLREMTEAQRGATRALLRATLSAKGYQLSRDIMRVEEYLARVTGNRHLYGGKNYNVTVMGEPSLSEPWGWQMDGNHLVINFFVLGDQVVMTPSFFGTEPAVIDTGRYAGTEVLQTEQDRGLSFMRSLRNEQRSQARVDSTKTGTSMRSAPFRDNVNLDDAGIRATQLSEAQRGRLLDLIGLYLHNFREGHAEVRMETVRKHLDETSFVWIGGVGPESVFYYRVQSPVLLIEFDHFPPGTLSGPPEPTRDHIHTVIRTPNGGDYGKSLLRQHYEAHEDNSDHKHRR